MKFPRNARIFRGHLEVAPFAAVFFLLVIFISLSSLMYTPGVTIQLPVADNLPGTDKPSVSVALDKNGRLFYENKWITETDLKTQMRRAVVESGKSLVLIIHADEEVSYKLLVRLTLAARDAGISEALLATLPRPMDSSALR
jgi:biopolymer transport protein ExbD